MGMMTIVLLSAPLAFFSSSGMVAFPRPRAFAWAAAAGPTTELQADAVLSGPSPTLDAEDVVSHICCGLQHVDNPNPGCGLEQLFQFSTNECRAALTARRGTDEMDAFVEHSNSQALQPLLRCSAYDVGEPKLIAGTPTRGALCTYVVTVWETSTAFRHHSGFERRANLEDCWLADDSTGSERAEEVRFTLQQERRPPLQGCWLVKEILPLRLQFLDWD